MEKCVLTHAKKSSMQRSQVKVMLITFFDHHGLVHREFDPQRQTVNQLFYKEVLTRLVNKIRQTQKAFWARKTWILHHDNASAHTASSVKQFLVLKEFTTLHHPPYSPYLAPCYFFFFFQNQKESSRGHVSKESRMSRPA